MYVCIFREKEIQLQTSVRLSVRTYFFPRLLSGPAQAEGGPAQGGKLIIYNRGRGGGGEGKEGRGRRGKEPEWAMGRTGRGGAQRVHYAPGTH